MMKLCRWVRMLCRLTKREYSVSIRARSKRQFLIITLIPSSGVVTVILQKEKSNWQDLFQKMSYVRLAEYSISSERKENKDG